MRLVVNEGYAPRIQRREGGWMLVVGSTSKSVQLGMAGVDAVEQADLLVGHLVTCEYRRDKGTYKINRVDRSKTADSPMEHDRMYLTFSKQSKLRLHLHLWL